jgi:hypothetical protein
MIPREQHACREQYPGINFNISLAFSLARSIARCNPRYHSCYHSRCYPRSSSRRAFHPHNHTFATSRTHLGVDSDDGFAFALAITLARTDAKLSHRYSVNTRAALRRTPDRSHPHSLPTLAQAGFWGTFLGSHTLAPYTTTNGI